MRRRLPLALLLLVGGCADLQPLVEALAKDPAAICVKLSSVWFSTTLDRNWGCEMPTGIVVRPSPPAN